MSTFHAHANTRHGERVLDITQLLSQRELEVVRYLPTRLSAIEIADHLYISYNTLKSHMRSIYRKFDVSSRPELIRRAEELGLA
jgi:LuxR family maltose regulon positive regulatory protein